jgi:hypothetical protein
MRLIASAFALINSSGSFGLLATTLFLNKETNWRVYFLEISQIGQTLKALGLQLEVSGADTKRRDRFEQHSAARPEEITITYRLYSQYRLTRLRYKPRPYSGNIVLIANEEWLKNDPTLGWNNDVLQGSLEVHKIPGDHNSYIMENLHFVVAMIKECLEKAIAKRNL